MADIIENFPANDQGDFHDQMLKIGSDVGTAARILLDFNGTSTPTPKKEKDSTEPDSQTPDLEDIDQKIKEMEGSRHQQSHHPPKNNGESMEDMFKDIFKHDGN
uniref:Uncharacterized protein n=1 Tax=Strombidium inclinatum TaxID=197538 RepID=A0A7S3INR2_9SPIT|mmetsp:Transcript_3097/g.4745  ORF Transcript_3097/g.4745 Transcript_3097/m.4745 type:complete len:104 (+) Transcript_3097:440-751(+)